MTTATLTNGTTITTPIAPTIDVATGTALALGDETEDSEKDKEDKEGNAESENVPTKMSANLKPGTVTAKEKIDVANTEPAPNNIENKTSATPSKEQNNETAQAEAQKPVNNLNNIGQNIEVPVKLFGVIKGEKNSAKGPSKFLRSTTNSNARSNCTGKWCLL